MLQYILVEHPYFSRQTPCTLLVEEVEGGL